MPSVETTSPPPPEALSIETKPSILKGAEVDSQRQQQDNAHSSYGSSSSNWIRPSAGQTIVDKDQPNKDVAEFAERRKLTWHQPRPRPRLSSNMSLNARTIRTSPPPIIATLEGDANSASQSEKVVTKVAPIRITASLASMTSTVSTAPKTQSTSAKTMRSTPSRVPLALPHGIIDLSCRSLIASYRSLLMLLCYWVFGKAPSSSPEPPSMITSSLSQTVLPKFRKSSIKSSASHVDTSFKRSREFVLESEEDEPKSRKRRSDRNTDFNDNLFFGGKLVIPKGVKRAAFFELA